MSRDLFDDTGSNIVHFPPGVGRRPTPRSASSPGGMVLAGLIAFFGVVFAVNGVLVHEALSTFGGVETEAPTTPDRPSNATSPWPRRRMSGIGSRRQVHARRDGAARCIDIRARDAAGAAAAGSIATAHVAAADRPPPRSPCRRPRRSRPAISRGSADDSPAGQWDLVIELSRHGERQFRSVIASSCSERPDDGGNTRSFDVRRARRRRHLAHDACGRGRRLRRLHPQDRERT